MKRTRETKLVPTLTYDYLHDYLSQRIKSQEQAIDTIVSQFFKHQSWHRFFLAGPDKCGKMMTVRTFYDCVASCCEYPESEAIFLQYRGAEFSLYDITTKGSQDRTKDQKEFTFLGNLVDRLGNRPKFLVIYFSTYACPHNLAKVVCEIINQAVASGKRYQHPTKVILFFTFSLIRMESKGFYDSFEVARQFIRRFLLEAEEWRDEFVNPIAAHIVPYYRLLDSDYEGFMRDLFEEIHFTKTSLGNNWSISLCHANTRGLPCLVTITRDFCLSQIPGWLEKWMILNMYCQTVDILQCIFLILVKDYYTENYLTFRNPIKS